MFGCILFHFYIKPQLNAKEHGIIMVVSYSISTSNHNTAIEFNRIQMLYLIPFLHQTTTNMSPYLLYVCCILFHFYIKPQHNRSPLLPILVVSYSISTSNHNEAEIKRSVCKLYLIPFLHQTTTGNQFQFTVARLYLIPFLHQTTTNIY